MGVGGTLSGLYRLKREGRNWYRDTSGGAYFETRYCSEYANGEEAVYDAGRQEIRFRNNATCPVRRAVTRYTSVQVDGQFNGWQWRTVVRLTNRQVWQQQQTDLTLSVDLELWPEALLFVEGGTTYMRIKGTDDTVAVVQLR